MRNPIGAVVCALLGHNYQDFYHHYVMHSEFAYCKCTRCGKRP
jgi:hypothetical protein